MTIIILISHRMLLVKITKGFSGADLTEVCQRVSAQIAQNYLCFPCTTCIYNTCDRLRG